MLSDRPLDRRIARTGHLTQLPVSAVRSDNSQRSGDRLADVIDESVSLSDALDKDQPMGVRLRAADLVTARGPGLLEIAHFAERLEEIERRLSDREKINDGD